MSQPYKNSRIQTELTRALRAERCRGQALVLTTLALFAIAGMMGLAVDLGWSFFVQKQAQSAADGAALSAAQEALAQIRSAGVAPPAFTCGGGVAGVDCLATATSCSQLTEATNSNLYNGCLYAKSNGFDYTTASSHQNVTMQSGTGAPPTAAGVNNIVYWVTVRTVQTVPQLFSAFFGHTQGTVSAVATAGIAGTIAPGSFYGMDHKGDCFNDSGGTQHCGLDLTTGTGQGKTTCPGAPSGNANVCAPSGIVLGSSCSAVVAGCTQAYAGASAGAGVYASSLTVAANGAISGSPWTPASPTYAPITSPVFDDPTAPNPQPPLQVPSSPISACGYASGIIPAGATLGPNQYYSWSLVNGVPTPDGGPIRIGANATFSPTATGTAGCPGNAASTVYTPGAPANASFPAFIFWGGMQATSNVTFGAGQYVMAGTTSNAPGATVFYADGSGNKTITGDSTTGTMFIFTDGNYPGLQTQLAGVPLQTPSNSTMGTLYQGTLDFKNANITLNGLVNSTNSTSSLPAAMDVYSGVVWWQDRRNSTVGYDEKAGSPGCPDCNGDNGSVLYCSSNSTCSIPNNAKLNTLVTDNHVTATSPGLTLNHGNSTLSLNGVYYQPRGAWMEFVDGTTNFSCGTSNCPLQVVTGALLEDSGNTRLLLAGLTNSLIQYKVALLQ